MAFDDKPEPPQRRAFLEGMGEAAGLLAGSIWQHEMRPRAELLTAKLGHLFGQKAGTHTFARLVDKDPTDYDALYPDLA